MARLVRRNEKETPVSSNLSDLIRKYYSSYESKDRKSLEDLLSDDFTFSSPLDDHISKRTYFQRCWRNSETISVFHIEKLFEKGPRRSAKRNQREISCSKFGARTWIQEVLAFCRRGRAIFAEQHGVNDLTLNI